MIYKLKYTDKESAISDLITKNILVENDKGFLNNSENTHAVVEIGLITLTDPTFDESGNMLTEPTYVDGYHYDVMTEEEVVFESEIIVNNPRHKFAGQ